MKSKIDPNTALMTSIGIDIGKEVFRRTRPRASSAQYRN
jgi:hypothetical protein